MLSGQLIRTLPGTNPMSQPRWPATTIAIWGTRLPATFVDTSALYALVVPDDADHASAVAALRLLRGRPLVTHNYVVVESAALTQARGGITATRRLVEDLLPIVSVEWVERSLHERAMTALLADSGRGISLVDHVSFALMRDLGMTAAFAFDEDFADQGFDLIPS